MQKLRQATGHPLGSILFSAIILPPISLTIFRMIDGEWNLRAALIFTAIYVVLQSLWEGLRWINR